MNKKVGNDDDGDGGDDDGDNGDSGDDDGGDDDGDDDDGNGWHLSPRQVLIALTFIKSFCP